MELKKPDYTARWVFPFPDEPETGVQMRKLTDAEVNRIYDRNKYVPGSKGATVSKASAVLNEMICASVQDWKGFTQDGVALECTDTNKILMLEQPMVGEDGERTSVWAVINEKFAKLQEADLKN